MIENPFKKILNCEEVPKLLKEKVLEDISFIKLSLDVADLFVVKYPEVIGTFLKEEDESKDKDE